MLILISAITVKTQNIQKALPNPDNWTVFNRDVDFNGEVIHMNAKKNDGVLWLNGSDFKNGTLELDIKGKDEQGKSFVGIAFHGLNDTTFDAVYFRPFNFKNPERNNHSVQYISMPANNWYVLRKAFPGKYENILTPVPEPVDDWFHAKVIIEYPHIKVYVNGSETASLEVDQISKHEHGQVGLWVGYGSEGWFRNLVITNK